MTPAPAQRARTTAVIRANPVFASLPARELDALAGVSRRELVRARDYVFVENDPPHWLCLVERGRVKIVRHTGAGKDVVIEMLGPGEVFGGVAVIERRPYPASAQAVEPGVIVKLPGDMIAALAARYPSIIREMALMMGRRLRAAHDSMTSLAVNPVEARLAAALLRLAEREGERTATGLRLPFPLTRQALGDMAGTTVETTIRIMRRWMKNRIVSDEGGRLVVTDVGRLRALASGARA